ncbi:DUF2255 family protein [Flavobacterium sp. PS2]|uniref:DUF2255 family protein n=1 Tax=Flavobacterium sp. PS2 TaxID=3384157 RepID=UPI00390C443E
MKNFDTETIDFIENNNLIGIKAGNERPDFLNIWMVTFDNRIFARSWGFAERSWYNTFLKDADGEIKCGERVIKISAVIPKDIALLNKKINEAYLKKYDSGDNSFYAHGIIKEEHIAKTMEFIVL